MIEFYVRGTPAPGGSKTPYPLRRKDGSYVYGRGGRIVIRMVDDSKGNKKWRAAVQKYARRVYTGEPLTGALRFVVEFRMPRPGAHFVSGNKERGELKGGLFGGEADDHIQKPDALKLARSTEDALTGIVWVDDCQVTQEYATKRWANPGELVGARIRIMRPIREGATV